jgi:hypothetical protein
MLRLGRAQSYSFNFGIVRDRERLEKASKDSGTVRVTAHIRIKYTQKATLVTEKDLTQTDSQSFWWNPTFKKWMDLSPTGQKLIKSLLNKKATFKEF